MDIIKLITQFFLDLTRELLVFIVEKHWLNGKKIKK